MYIIFLLLLIISSLSFREKYVPRVTEIAPFKKLFLKNPSPFAAPIFGTARRAYIPELIKDNDGNKYLLVAIDVFSRHGVNL